MRVKSGLFADKGADDAQLVFTQSLPKRKLCGTPVSCSARVKNQISDPGSA
jgi:hypothetical protein